MSQSLLHLPSQGMRLSLASSSLLCARCSARQFPSAISSSVLYSRPFSTTKRNNAAVGDMQPIDSSSLSIFKTPSRRAQMQKMVGKQMGQDLGRIPGALIIPPSKELPSWLGRDFVKRLRIHWLQLKTAVTDWAGLFTFLWWEAPRDPITGRKIRKNMDLSERTDIARQLHREFNTALSKGDLKMIQSIACEGLVGQARTRIGRRKTYARTDEPWKIVKYLGIDYPSWLARWPVAVLLPRATARVVSDKINPLPLGDSHIRQCTVRIKSLQHYLPADREDPLLMIHTDYVVIQKMTMRGDESPWMIWGTVEPSTMAEVDKLLEGNSPDATTTLTERIQEKMSKMTGF